MLRLTRAKLMLIGWLAVLVVFVVCKIVCILNANTATGEVIGYESVYSDDSTTIEAVYPVIAFRTKSGTINFRGEESVRLEIGERLPIIYPTSNPRDAEVYTFMGFWFRPLLLLPLMAWTAVVMGIGKKGSYWTIYFPRFKIVRTELQRKAG